MTAGWWQDARCRTAASPDVFYNPARVDEAKRMCAGCPVRGDCLADALARREMQGVWGGLTPGERIDARFLVIEQERDRVLAEVRSGVRSVRRLSERIGVDAETIRRHLHRLDHDGLVVVERPDGGRLRVSPTELSSW